MKEIIDVYEKVTERKNFKAGRVKMSPQTIHDHDLLLKAIHAFSPLGGWLCYQSKVVRLPEDSLPDDQGKLLYGELVNGRKSLHIRQKGANWLVNELDAGSGDDCLVRKISYCLGENQYADYEVYWQKEFLEQKDEPDQDLGYFPKSYRFTGFRYGEE